MSNDLVQVLKDALKTNVTHTVHTKPYDTLSLTRPELSQAGKTVLITGGGTNIGLAIAHSFAEASAHTIIIVGRRADVLKAARDELEASGTSTKIIARSCDIVKRSDVDALWKYLSDEGISVDVFVSNAAKIGEPVPLLEQGFDEVWSNVDANVKAPMYLTDKFYKQGGDKPKVSILR